MTDKHAARVGLALAAAFVLFQAWWIHAGFAGFGRYSDELHHDRQIRRFCTGDYTPDPRITTIPGYHVLCVAVGLLTGDCGHERTRLVNVAIGVVSAAVFWAAARAAGSEMPVARALQFYFLPVLLPYFFLVYADPVSILGNLLTMLLLFRGRFRGASLVAGLAVLVRQTNVLWLLLVCLVVALDDPGWRRAERPLRAYLSRVWPALLGLVGFAAFLLWNRGVAVGGRGAFAAGVHSGNVFLFLALYFVLFLPANLAILHRHRQRLADPFLGALLLLAYGAYMASFRLDHPFNRIDGFLRNDLLSLVTSSVFARGAFFLLAAGGLASLRFTRLRRPSLYALYPLVLASLVPLRMVEHRYGLAGFVLILLCRRDESPGTEALGVAHVLLLSAVLLHGLTTGLWMM